MKPLKPLSEKFDPVKHKDVLPWADPIVIDKCICCGKKHAANDESRACAEWLRTVLDTSPMSVTVEDMTKRMAQSLAIGGTQ